MKIRMFFKCIEFLLALVLATSFTVQEDRDTAEFGVKLDKSGFKRLFELMKEFSGEKLINNLFSPGRIKTDVDFYFDGQELTSKILWQDAAFDSRRGQIPIRLKIQGDTLNIMLSPQQTKDLSEKLTRIPDQQELKDAEKG